MSTTNTASPGKVLVVDDEPQNLQLVGENLRRAGIPCMFAIDGNEALQVVKEDPPSLILLDVMMPGMDGFEVCNTLKADTSTEHIPIIFLTAASSTSDLVSGFASGAVDYIRKPFIREELLARVRTHLHLQEVHKQLDTQALQRAEMLTRLSHDIKNPSSGIAGLVQLIREDILEHGTADKETHSMLDLIESCAIGMSELVNGILDEARGTEDQQSTVKTSIQVSDVLQHLVSLNAVHAKTRNIRLEFTPEEQPSVPIGRRILSEMFDNLLSNAVKYSRPESCIQVRITKAQALENGFRVEVEDSATVLEPAKADLLFKRFTRGEQENSSPQSSHGVGLSVVKRLVDFHDGVVGVHARSDELGNIFFIELPIPTSSA